MVYKPRKQMADNPSLSANSNRFDVADKRAMVLSAFPASVGAEHSSIAPIAT
jgi:hypothetical protein